MQLVAGDADVKGMGDSAVRAVVAVASSCVDGQLRYCAVLYYVGLLLSCCIELSFLRSACRQTGGVAVSSSHFQAFH